MQSTIVYRPDFTVGGFIQKIGGLYLFRFDNVHGSEFFHVHPDEYWWLDREFDEYRYWGPGRECGEHHGEFMYVEEVVLGNLKLTRDDGEYFIDGVNVTNNSYLVEQIDDVLARRNG